MKPQFTTHIECDVPDEMAGVVQRYLTGIKGITNFVTQTNGTERRRGEKPSKMNAATKKEVIIGYLTDAQGPVNIGEIAAEVKKAGYVHVGLGSYMSDLVAAKLITRVGRGVYSGPKAIAPPKKKKEASNNG